MDDRVALAKARAKRGHVIGQNYVLDDVVGIGGMGVVHVALQRSLERTVAVKLPRPELVLDQQVRELFRNEALAGSRLNHRNTVCIHDFGDEHGMPYLVMEHIVGPRLGQLLAELGPLPFDAAVDIVRQVVGALEDAHANGVVHADVKCDNIIIQTMRDGTVVPRLIDFGIARFIDRDTPATQVERFVTGTPEYVAPEVVRGQLPTLASDVYAIGVMLYELITNTTPFGYGPASAIMSRKLESDAVPISCYYPELGIPPELDALVSRTLARDPGDRPQDAHAVAKWLASLPKLKPTGTVRRTLSVAATFSTEANTARMTASRAAKAERPSVADRRIQVHDAMKTGSGEQVAAAYLDLARALIDEHRLAAAQAELEEGVELLMTPDGRGPVWRLLLSLAALYERHGDHARARKAARAANQRGRQWEDTPRSQSHA